MAKSMGSHAARTILAMMRHSIMRATALSPRRRRLRWLGQLALANGLLALLLSSRYFVVGQPLSDIWTMLYLLLALPGHMLLLAFLPVLLLLGPLALLPFTERLLRLLAPFVATCGILFLLLDSAVFQQYRFHMDGVVWELLFSGNAVQIFRFSLTTWLLAATALLLLLAGEFLVASWLWRRPHRRSRGGLLTVLFAVSLLGGHLMHMVADVWPYPNILSAARYIPAHWPLTARHQLLDWGLITIENKRLDSGAIAPVGADFVYPEEDLHCQSPAQRPNILMLVLDSWRYDMLTAEVAPQMYALAQQSQSFKNHISVGNATRSGLFSLLYGIPPTYWAHARHSGQGAFLLDRAKALDYTLLLRSSAPLFSLSFEKTVFQAGGDQILVDHGSGSVGDRRITEDFLAFLEQPQQDPFFAFLMFNTVHNWHYPQQPAGPFQPEERINYLLLNKDYDATAITNYYRNLVHFVDGLVGRVLAALRTKGMLDDTVVLLTGDHGQELNDNGRNYWGHGSNYSRAQIGVPLLLHWPGRAPVEHRHRSTHYDVSYTLLTEFMGCQAAPAGPLGSGYHLLDPRPRPWLLSNQWKQYVVIEPDRVMVRHLSGLYQFFDPSYAPLPDAAIRPDILRAALEEKRRFLRSTP